MKTFKAILAGIIFGAVAVGVVLFSIMFPKIGKENNDEKKLKEKLSDRRKSINDFLNHHPRRERV